MKPTVRVAETKTPDGHEMVLQRHDERYCIRVDGQVLMSSWQHESELELARLGGAHLAGRKDPSVLIGGLGLGYTLRQCLDLVGPRASVTVCELMPEVIAWNREFLGGLTKHPLRDKRVRVVNGDVVKLLSERKGQFDAVLLDVDNGPSAMTDSANHRLYEWEGVCACCAALKTKGCLAVWSANPDKAYERVMMRAKLHVRRYRAPAYKGSKAQARFVWVASREKALLPPGGGEPKKPMKKAGKRTRSHARRGAA